MNAPRSLVQSSSLARVALSTFDVDPGQGEEAQWLDALRRQQGDSPQVAWQRWLAAPPEVDFELVNMGSRYGLTGVEMMAVALACAAELEPMVPRLLHHLQTPVASSLPTLGLVARAARSLDVDSELNAHLTSLHSGMARQLGLIELLGGTGVLVERSFRVPQALALALAGYESSWPEVVLPVPDIVELGEKNEQSLADLALTLLARPPGEQGPIVLRSAWAHDGFSAAACLTSALGRTLVHLPLVVPDGVGAWIQATGRVPLFHVELAPGESRKLSRVPGYEGPFIVLTGPDGEVQWNHGACAQWTLPLPQAPERAALWRAGGLPGPIAQRLGAQMRLSAGRIHELAVEAHRSAARDGRSVASIRDVGAASRNGAALSLGSQAQLLSDEVVDEALVMPPALRDNLEELLQRCQQRDLLAENLGLAVRTRYRPGVRALFTGSSGTGKTLAAGWLATRLGLPLYRVDLSAVVSKYIGETEKNLAQLFARADSSEVVLLFDEADALFGKRTDIKDSNDRFANQQTNYLLQRIESFDGIAVLTSNSRTRFDAAFTRRLDTVIEFGAPTPEERRALWLAHLGQGHGLDAAEINRLAAVCDLAGGHIRSCTLMAASLARPIRYAELRRAVQAEYAKLGRMPPTGL
jgi:hypothetical protein